VNSRFTASRTLPRIVAYLGLWLLLSCVFASQLYLAGFVTPWLRAFAAEAVYWLSWWILAPCVFGGAAGCLFRMDMARAGLLLGAIAATLAVR
jgi:hypothetical protein